MRVLIIGSLRGYSTMAAKIAISKGAKVSLVTTVEEALNTLRIGKGAELILIDLSLDVKKLVTHLTEERFLIPVISCGIASDPKQAADTIRAGAKDYIPLPPDAELIAAVFGALAREDKAFICQDPKMLNLLKLVAKVASSEANILITGESGTGKEVLANYLHHQSNRCDKIFVSLNCAAIPENLLESELFGHEKGAFTGAVARRIGKFEEADGGTLFLDEISEMHPHLQAKLLRAIQEKTIDRVGGTQPIKVNIRIIATSNRNLLEAVQQKQFREDLYFRLNVVNLHIPSLKERPLDIIPLAEHFIEKYTHLNQLDSRTISLAAQQKLQNHEWQGNVRELENTIHRAVLLSQTSVLEIEDIFGYSQHSSINHTNDNQLINTSLVGRTVSEVEKELILGTLNHCLGNRTHAANILGISIRTLRNKLKEYNDTQLTPAPIVKQG